jgi:hypothetical protein
MDTKMRAQGLLNLLGTVQPGIRGVMADIRGLFWNEVMINQEGMPKLTMRSWHDVGRAQRIHQRICISN